MKTSDALVFRVVCILAGVVLCSGVASPDSIVPEIQEAAGVTNPVSFVAEGEGQLEPTTRWFTQKMDHHDSASSTFKQRYLTNFDHCRKKGCPILFYCGNELAITSLWRNTGFMHDLAGPLNAALIFVEHRFYGRTGPPLDSSNAQHLTVEQALTDFKTVIEHIKNTSGGGARKRRGRQLMNRTVPDLRNSPVIAFGGSYGGMLAAWFRMAYPGVVTGAIASSAPVRSFIDTPNIKKDAFYEAVTTDFRKAGASCDRMIHDALGAVDRLRHSDKGRRLISHALHLCSPLGDAAAGSTLQSFLHTGLQYMAMSDYPYATSFLKPMPANPVQLACRRAHAIHVMSRKKGGTKGQRRGKEEHASNDETLLKALGAAVRVYYMSHEPQSACLDTSVKMSDCGLGEKQWSYQACTELVQPMEHKGQMPRDMFVPARDWSISTLRSGCEDWNYGQPMKLHHLWKKFGDDQIAQASNIVFSNGKLDPWYPSGVLSAPSAAVHTLLMRGAAHHLDLRAAHDADPQDVKRARRTHKRHIKRWIAQHKTGRKGLKRRGGAGIH